MINVVDKGKGGEREVAKLLNAVIQEVLRAQQWSPEAIKAAEQCVQRNQNQSAVGGADLANVFGLAVEVKRQETLSVNSWWAQCCASAARNREFPVLIFRQNNKAWRIVLPVSVPLPHPNEGSAWDTEIGMRAEISKEDFLKWFRAWVYCKLLNGDYPRV